jgi:probable DNA repair protein
LARFSASTLAAIDAGRALIVDSPQRAAAVRAAYGEEQIAAGRRAWRTPQALTFHQWAANALTLRGPARLTATQRFLSDREEWALFRAAADALTPQHEYLTRRALATQLRSASVLLDEWHLSTRLSQLGASAEGALLRTGLQHVAERCQALGARPLRQSWQELPTGAAQSLAYTPHNHTSARRAALEKGGASQLATTRATLGTAHQSAHESPAAECAALAAWCRAKLLAQPRSRLLVIAPDLSERRAVLERTLSQALEPSRWLEGDDGSRAYAVEGGQPVGTFPLVASATGSLRLLSRPLAFETVSSWLRDPYLAEPSPSARAQFDLWLRSMGRLQLGAAEIAQVSAHTGAPAGSAALGARLTAASGALQGGARDARGWAQAFERALLALGWPGSRSLHSIEQQIRARWLELLAEFAGLSETLDRMTLPDAVDAIAELADVTRFDAASADVPIVITDALHVPVVQYDAIWVMGLDAETWPPPASPHALVPLRWQVEAGIPEASAAAQANRAETMLRLWRGHAAEVVFSAPLKRDDAECAMSTSLASLPIADAAGPTISLAAQIRGEPVFEFIDDSVGEPWDTRTPVSHGVRPIELQARCAFRAYGELRLTATPIESPQSGIDPRDRGIWLHQALAQFWREIGDSATLAALDEPELARRAAQCVRAARDHNQRKWRGNVSASTAAREEARLAQLLVVGALAERERTPFKVIATEHRFDAQLAQGKFRFVFDRVDQLLDEPGFVLIDYKSGAPQRLEWSAPRLSAPQLLAYLAADREHDVRALALQFLTTRRAVYRGHAARSAMLPGVSVPGVHPRKKLAAEEGAALWQEWTHRWAAQIEQLAADYVTGVATVNPATPQDCDRCHLTALCRRHELSLRYAAMESGADEADDEAASE